MPLSTPITVRFDDEEMEALKAKAEQERRSVGFLVREAVTLFLSIDGNAAKPANVTPGQEVTS